MRHDVFEIEPALAEEHVVDFLRSVRRADPGRPECCNVYTLHGYLSAPDVVASVDRDCRTAAIGCVDCKKLLHESLVRVLDPIRARAEALYSKPAAVWEILHEGGKKARAEAKQTMAIVRERCGLRPPL